jgi:enterochelin esterase-like enzyme
MMAQSKDANLMPDIRDKSFTERLSQENSPVIDDYWATFVYRGNAEDVELVGEMTGWQQRGLKLKPLVGTDVKYYSLPFLSDARIEYKFLVDGEWQLDSLNPQRNDNSEGGLNNYFTMARYRPSEWAMENPDNPPGRIENIGDELRANRQICIYLPPDYDSTEAHYPTIYFSNGIAYLERARVNLIADNLIAAPRICPLIMVCFASIDRKYDYWANRDYVDYLVGDLVPKIDAKYRTIKAPQSRALAGAAPGGLLAAFAAHLHSDIFGNVLGQSSAFSANDHQVIEDFEQSEKRDINWFLEAGRYEPLLESNRRMKAVLDAKGYAVRYRELSAGHNWTHWKDALSDGLIYLFPNAER